MSTAPLRNRRSKTNPSRAPPVCDRLDVPAHTTQPLEVHNTTPLLISKDVLVFREREKPTPHPDQKDLKKNPTLTDAILETEEG